MKILKKCLFGAIVGMLYAFVNFYLITPFLRPNVFAILFWGLQGGLYILSWELGTIVLPHRQNNMTIALLKGGFSGLMACSLNIFISWQGYSQIIADEGILVPTQVMKKINLDLIYYGLGCVIVGIAIGFFLYTQRQRKGRGVT